MYRLVNIITAEVIELRKKEEVYGLLKGRIENQGDSLLNWHCGAETSNILSIANRKIVKKHRLSDSLLTLYSMGERARYIQATVEQSNCDPEVIKWFAFVNNRLTKEQK